MRKEKIILVLLALLFTGALRAQVQQVKFNPTYSIQDIRAEYGRIFQSAGYNWSAPYMQVAFTRQFWGPLAYKLGGQLILGREDMDGFNYMFGVPVALAYRPGSRSFASSVSSAAGMSIFDAVWYGMVGRPENIGRSILLNFVMALFRRSEYFVGLTPGYYPGGHFVLTADAGLTLSIPIWRLGLNITPTYHYAIKPFTFEENDTPIRSLFSITGGITYLF